MDWYKEIMKAGHGMVADNLPSVKTDMLEFPSPSLNWALDGGAAFGKVLTVFGPQQAGKSLLGLLAIAEMHREDPEAWAVWYDAEFSFDRDHAAKLGVDTKRVWLIPTNKPGDIFDHFATDVRAKMDEGFKCRIMAIDSIKSIKGPREADAKSVEDHVIGDLSGLLQKAFRKIVEPIRKFNVLTILVQQVTEEMDMGKQMQGVKWHVPSGQALKHFSDYMLLVEKVDSKKEKLFDESHKNIQDLPTQIGHKVRVKIEKNRTGTPHRIAEFRLQYGRGIVDTYLEVATMGVNYGIISRPSPVTYVFNDTKVSGGFEKFATYVKEHPELQREILKEIYKVSDEVVAAAGDSKESVELDD
jgi:RecA/RadA recombinase